MNDKTHNFPRVINLDDYRNHKEELEQQEINELADQLMYRAYIPDGNALAPLLKIRAASSNRQALVIWIRGKKAIIASLKEEGCDLLDCLEHELNLALMR
jgi:hypothetical protein